MKIVNGKKTVKPAPAPEPQPQQQRLLPDDHALYRGLSDAGKASVDALLRASTVGNSYTLYCETNGATFYADTLQVTQEQDPYAQRTGLVVGVRYRTFVRASLDVTKAQFNTIQQCSKFNVRIIEPQKQVTLNDGLIVGRSWEDLPDGKIRYNVTILCPFSAI